MLDAFSKERSRRNAMTRIAPVVLVFALIFSLVSGVSASAQDTQGPGSQGPGSEAARYSFFKIQDTFVRLDSQTGQVAQCGHGGSGWSCKLAPDERAALENEIARIQGENATLKKELLARGIELPANVKADPAPAPGPMAKAPETRPEPNAEPRPVPPRDVPQEPSVRLPSDAELDKVMNWMEKVWGRLVDMMAKLQRDVQRKTDKTENKTEQKPDKS
jgi:hypothetical protein